MGIQSIKSPLALFVVTLLGSSFAFGQASWTPLGSGTANDMSADGSVVVGEDSGGYIWTASGGQLSIGGDEALAVSNVFISK